MKNAQYTKMLSLTAGALLILAVLSVWPYAYFQILRWVVAIAAVLNAYHAYKLGRTEWVVVMGGMAVLFNPVAPIFLAKSTWTVLDIAAAALLFIVPRTLEKGK